MLRHVGLSIKSEEGLINKTQERHIYMKNECVRNSKSANYESHLRNGIGLPKDGEGQPKT